jgi:molybdate transport system ATP-binding protein
MGSLHVDVSVPRRAFELELALDVADETVALVGPSGAGKTTVLRAVAGLERPRRGTIRCGDQTWLDCGRRIDRRTEDRAVGFVFQDYALFPHLTAEQNVAFGGDPAGLLDRLGIASLAGVRPGRLSGGERQRVALARALARRPSVLLLDEPMAALDPHTRGSVRAELRRLLGELALPTLLVTHDFEDASALADRVGVVVEGRLLQLAPPEDLLAAPADPFVARFAGGNVLRGHVRGQTRDGALTEVALEDGSIVYSTDEATGDVSVVVYPWTVSVSRDAPTDSALNHLRHQIESLVTVANRVRVRVGPLTAEVTAASVERLRLRVGERVVASFKATATRLL